MIAERLSVRMVLDAIAGVKANREMGSL